MTLLSHLHQNFMYPAILATGQRITTTQTAFNHCTFQVITAHFVHHCTLIKTCPGPYFTINRDTLCSTALGIAYTLSLRDRDSRHMLLHVWLLQNPCSVCERDYLREVSQCHVKRSTSHRGTWWRLGWADDFQPEGRAFDSRSSRHVMTLGKSFTYSCLCASAWNSDTVSVL